MPILDPSLQCCLVSQYMNSEDNGHLSFVLRYLKLAYLEKMKSFTTLLAADVFKKDLKNWIDKGSKLIPLIPEEFKDYNESEISDYYIYLYSKIDITNKEKLHKQHDGIFYICDDQFRTKFFQPFVIRPNIYSWFLSDTAVAILCIDGNRLDKEELILWIKLEIDLMAAVGFTLVFCAIGNSRNNKYFLELLKDDQFAEIHFNNNDPSFFKNMDENYSFLFKISKGYAYIYTITPNEYSIEVKKKYSKKHHLKIISFCQDPIKSFKNINLHFTNPFYYCQTASFSDYLCIRLSNVPIYDTEDDYTDLSPSETSGINISYIKSTEFLKWSQSRKEILFDQEFHHLAVKYVNYDDIHLIKPELYVKDTLSLANISQEKYQKILEIKPEIIEKIKEKDTFSKEKFRKWMVTQKVLDDIIKYASYAYTFINSKNSNQFELHEAQLLTVIEACNNLIVKNTNSKGTIFQVETGEGKSCIVCLIAATLVLLNKTVHIVSSNIYLANRDYNNSFEFFDLLGFSSAVLLHKNELPFNMITNSDESNEYLKKFKNPDYVNFSKERYPDKYFGDNLFKNPLGMNFDICGIDDNNKKIKDKPNIIFSTFVNFECLYLKLFESSCDISKVFNNCGLIIDEVDSILIDEIENGTIVSASMRTNVAQITKFVYDLHKKGESYEETYLKVIKKWPKLGNLSKNDIRRMYEEIELVNEDEFTNGKKYSVEILPVEDEDLIKEMRKKTLKYIMNIGKEKEDIIESTEPFKHIVPFDYKGKGILEPNKEFSGTIQQFIAIKESEKKGNENLIIKDLSMNYLYVSHPVFASLYSKICGLTGTIGNKSDRLIYKEQYKLETMKIPRNKPNLTVKMPTIICKSFSERDKKIVSEVISFHKRNYPVLVIFQDLKEISKVEKLLISNGIQHINIFDGKNEIVGPEKIAGIKDAVSLGTNVCGRGTDIIASKYPLHIIVTYYSSNVRVMKQAFGRTARHGRKGTFRVICHKDQFLLKDESSKEKMTNVINFFNIKNKMQNEFVNHYQKMNPWIFIGKLKKQDGLKSNQIEQIRKSRINVNRIVAYKYEFPMSMTYKQFLDLQAQRIFSLVNCPNCVYTWILFQRYLREMILESWSLMIKEHDQEFMYNNLGFDQYVEKLKERSKNLQNALDRYIIKAPNSNVVEVFLNIHKIVCQKYEADISDIYKNVFKRFDTSKRFFSCQIGFIPYSLLDRSGARIDAGNIGELNYITDPELIYERRNAKGPKFILSITEKIDDIFNIICQKINELIGSKIGLKFFLRRHLAGCDFGVCLDLEITKADLNNIDHYVLIDSDPLLVFSISVRSMKPILAGILIIALVYIASVCKKIIEWIAAMIPMLAENAFKAILKTIIKLGTCSLIDKAFDKINSFLINVLKKQIDYINNFDLSASSVLHYIYCLFIEHDFDKLGDEISKLIGIRVKMSPHFLRKMHDMTSYGKLIKTAVLLILCIGSFIINFYYHKKQIKFDDDEKTANEYDTNCHNYFIKSKLVRYVTNREKVYELARENEKKVKIEDQIKDKSIKSDFDAFFNKSDVKQSFLLEMEKCNVYDFIISPDIITIGPMKRKIGSAFVSYWPNNMKYANQKYIQIKRFGELGNLQQEIVLYIKLIHPFIIGFRGFYTEGKKSFVYIYHQKNGFLDEYIHNQDNFLNPTQKIIIAYGIAHVMNYIHSKKVIHGNLKTENILLNEKLYPKILNFYMSRHIEKKSSEIKIIKDDLRYMPPEFIENSEACYNSFEIDVYSYGLLLFELITETNPFANYTDKNKIYQDVINGKRPPFPPGTRPEWKDLISNCWDQDPNKRPSFAVILNFLRYDQFYNDPMVNENMVLNFVNNETKF
ncbi:hypothetical protein M9Y10_010320 [Tritrichomonas musculus]|uniref:Protein translocase subunit SecA n=1 Tax=Tritrichomonas musculus TaxID=1915356 RepID=A0ABR2IKJ9_9EUKA